MELSSRRKLRIRKRVLMCYPEAGIDFIKGRLDIMFGSRDVIIHVGRNSIINMDGTFERSKTFS